MKQFNWFDWFCLTLVIIGALNWGMMGFFNLNLVNLIFGAGIERIIYGLVGLTGLYSIFIFGFKLAHRKE